VDGAEEGRYEEFKWEILGDAVDEDWQGLWEPLLWARTALPDLSEAERQAMAERALRELFADKLVFFFKADSEFFEGTKSPELLDQAEVDAAIASASWRSVPLGEASIWFGGTASREREVRAHWPGTSTPELRADALRRFRPDIA